MKIIPRVTTVFLLGLLMACASGKEGGPAPSGDTAPAEVSSAQPASGGGESPASAPSPAAEEAPAEPPAPAVEATVTIVKPKNTATVSGPVEVCMETEGVTVEPAKNGVNEGKGHHHLIIDVDLPDLSQPVPKDDKHIHMGDGSKCKTIELSRGMHTVQALFARGNHIPYDPPVTDSVVVFVE